MTSPPSRRLRLPSFRASYALAVAILLGCAAWVLLDAYVPDALRLAGTDLGLRENTYFDNGMDIRPELRHPARLGLREAAVLGLALAAGLLLVLVAVRLFVGERSGRGLRSWVLAVLLVAGWLGLWASYEDLWWSGARFRAWRRLSRFKASAAPLLRSWPNRVVELPGAGMYDLRGEDALWRLDPDTSFAPRGDFGRLVGRSGDVLRFELAPEPDCFVESHPPGSIPADFTFVHGSGLFSGYRLRRAAHLGDGWYLAQYAAPIHGIQFGSIPDKGPSP